MNLEKQKEHFKNHIAAFTDYGNIKILDFKAPGTLHYRIRFLFEDDHHTLHISGDLGELTAVNYDNMTYERFSDFVNSPGYFKEKIKCHSRPLCKYDVIKARKDIKKWLEENNYIDSVLAMYDNESFWFDSDEDVLNEFLDSVLYDFSDKTGIGFHGYELLSDVYQDAWDVCDNFGKIDTGIIDLYMLAFKLAQNNLQKNKSEE